MRLTALCAIVLAALVAGEARAERAGVRTDTPSGLPVPRFVSLKFDRTVCRIGPSFEHPAAYTYRRVGLPVRVTAETRDHWRRIEDFEGAVCWAHQSTLIGVNHAIAAHPLDLRAAPKASAPVRARLGSGVIAKLEKSRGGWRRITARGVTGWAEEDALWGVD